MKAARSFETSRTSQPTTQRYTPADLNPEPYHCDKIEFRIPCYITVNRNTSGVKRIAQMAAPETTELEWYVWNQGFGSNRDDEGIRQKKFPPVFKRDGSKTYRIKMFGNEKLECADQRNLLCSARASCISNERHFVCSLTPSSEGNL